MSDDKVRGWPDDHRIATPTEPDEGNAPYMMPRAPDYATVWEQLKREAKRNERLQQLIDNMRAPH